MTQQKTKLGYETYQVVKSSRVLKCLSHVPCDAVEEYLERHYTESYLGCFLFLAFYSQLLPFDLAPIPILYVFVNMAWFWAFVWGL